MSKTFRYQSNSDNLKKIKKKNKRTQFKKLIRQIKSGKVDPEELDDNLEFNWRVR